MKRLLLSVTGGVAIPILYSIIVGPLSTYIEDRNLNDFLSFPVRWPVIWFLRFFPSSFPDGWTGVVLILGCDVLLYTILTYVILLAVWKPKVAPRLPPPPVHE